MKLEEYLSPEEEARRDAAESTLVNRRINELLETPIQGSYDIAHLKETHRYIFQDLPDADLWPYDVQPGEFRVPTETWCKDRVLESIEGADGKKPDYSFTAYSRMDGRAIGRLEAVLEGAKPENFRGLLGKTFASMMSIQSPQFSANIFLTTSTTR